MLERQSQWRKTDNVPREIHILGIVAHCNNDNNIAGIEELGSFSLHEPDRRLCLAAEATPSLCLSRLVGYYILEAKTELHVDLLWSMLESNPLSQIIRAGNAKIWSHCCRKKITKAFLNPQMCKN